MKPNDWKKYRYFSERDNWGNSYTMHEELIEKLELMREKMGEPFTIFCGTQGKHIKNSFHYVGMACDGAFKQDIPLIEQYLIAERCCFGAIGLYPQWKNLTTNKPWPGMHLDIRPCKIGARWIQWNGVYFALNYANLKNMECL